jgi:hypothetical protein
MSKHHYSLLPIHKYINNVNTNITYKTYIYYCSFFQPFNLNYKYALINTQGTNDNVCLKMFMIDYTSTNEVLFNISSLIKTEEVAPIQRIYTIDTILKYLDNSSKKDLLLISNTFIINQFININYTVDYMPIENEDMKKQKYDDFLNNSKKNVNRLIFNSLYQKEDENNYIKKYNNIIIKLNEFSSEIYFSLYGLTKLPYLLFTILKSLKCIEDNGQLFIIFSFTYINKAFEWIINLLTYLFDDVEINTENNTLTNTFITTFILICKKFKKEKFTTKIIDMINNILNDKSILKYNYNCCEVLNYYSSINHKNAKKFDYNFNIYPLNIEFNTEFKPMQILNSIDIDINKYIESEEKNKHQVSSDYINDKLKKLYISAIEINNYNILKYVIIQKDKLSIDRKFIDNIYYYKLSNSIEYFEKHKIPYNKSYLIYINKFNKDIINQVFSYKKPIKYNIDSKTNKTIEKININYKNVNKNIYKYDIIEKNKELLHIGFKVKYDILDRYIASSEKKTKLDTIKITSIIQNIENGFIDSIPQYINKNLNLKYKVDNIFCEILEIYNICNSIFPIKQNNTSILLLNELSGQGLYASEMFNIYNNILQQYDEQQRIDWMGISFNKNHLINRTKYNQQFKDNKTILHKKDIKKINYSINDTGDILNSSTQQWYHSNNKSLDIIIADTTSVFNNQNILLTQKLEFATLCMIAGMSVHNTNCIVKYRLPYDININNYSSGFLINIIYVYSLLFNSIKLIKPLNNNNLSFDFYIVCKGFKGIDNSILEKLLNILDNFEENICFINQKDIPRTFVEQVGSFINELLLKNINNIEITNFLTTCLLNTNSEYFKKAQCNVYLNKKFMDKLEEDQIKDWMKDNNL